MRLRSDNVFWRRIDDEIIGLADGEYFILNATGTVLWESMDGHDVTSEQMAARLCAEFEVGRTAAQRDVAAFRELLSGHGLIEGPTQD